MNSNFVPNKLPLPNEYVNCMSFLNELVDATAKLEVYKEKIKDSKIRSSWFMPTLQQKEALASSSLEGTQATLDGVLISQIEHCDENINLNEVNNYNKASNLGYKFLSADIFSTEFFNQLHSTLMDGNVRKPQVIGQYRTKQNFIGKKDPTHAITFVPPSPEKVPEYMSNLIDYINAPSDTFRPLVRIAIIHAQFETIHPYMDGNGRVGRMLIPLYLFAHRQIELPCFFVSEALEQDKLKYYSLLNETRKNNWNDWIKFFLEKVSYQCDKYISVITRINHLYEEHLKVVNSLLNSKSGVEFLNTLYKYPICNTKLLHEKTGIPMATINRFIKVLVEERILFSNEKKRNRTFFYYDLLNLIRD